MQPATQPLSSQQHEQITRGNQDTQASFGEIPVRPASGQPAIKTRPVVPALPLGGTSSVKAAARASVGLPRASSSPGAMPRDRSHNDAAPDQPPRTAEGGSKRTIDGKDGPGWKERKETKRQRGNSTEEAQSVESAAPAKVAVYEDKPTEKKLVRIRRETDLKERGRLSPRRAAPDSPVADALQTTPASGGTTASTAQSGKAAWRRSSQAPKPETGTPSGITLSPRRGSDARHASASRPVYQADLASTSLPTLPGSADESLLNDSFSFAPCDEDEHGAIAARNPLPALPVTTPGKAAVPDGSSGKAEDVPAPANDSQSVAPSPTPQAPPRFPSATLAMLEDVLRDWDEQMPADSDKPN